jgi:hypothetical protein
VDELLYPPECESLVEEADVGFAIGLKGGST